jgi:hypothetical protein
MIDPKGINEKTLKSIDKDVPRTKNITNFLP